MIVFASLCLTTTTCGCYPSSKALYLRTLISSSIFFLLIFSFVQIVFISLESSFYLLSLDFSLFSKSRYLGADDKGSSF